MEHVPLFVGIASRGERSRFSSSSIYI